MLTRKKQRAIALVGAFITMALTPAAASAGLTASYLYNLSNFTGPVSASWPKVSVDTLQNEIYMLNSSDLTARIFNENGMEVYRFDIGGKTGMVYDIAVDKDGSMIALSSSGSTYAIVLRNFRGEPLSNLELKGLPPELSGQFFPDTILYREGRLFLIDKGSMKVVVTDASGSFERFYDLFSILKLDASKRNEMNMSGFAVDREGNMLFTIAVLFQAFRLSPDGVVTAFGERGSAPGKFNVVAGIASDDRGDVYVVDTLKCVVNVFDKDLRFLTHFGFRGLGPGNLIAPRDVVVHRDRVYVTQSRDRGVNVYKISYD